MTGDATVHVTMGLPDEPRGYVTARLEEPGFETWAIVSIGGGVTVRAPLSVVEDWLVGLREAIDWAIDRDKEDAT